MGRIFSPGKLLLTSEYTVLDGALALAVPTKPGQEFFFEEKQNGNSKVTWTAHHQGKLWLKAIIDYQEWKVMETNLPDSADFILKVLQNVQKLSSVKFQESDDYFLNTNLQFPPDFGLGSSSTLMNNLAEWAETDPFVLNDMSLGGSGYDIAVAKEKSAILYQRNADIRTEKINFNPDFKTEIIFIHLNQKQDSREGIQLYRSKEKSHEIIDFFTEITESVLCAETLQEFSDLMTLHEEKLSNFLELPTVKDKFFADCPAFVKSLGAWGGDFVMSSKFSDYRTYFAQLGFSSVFEWDDIIA